MRRILFIAVCICCMAGISCSTDGLSRDNAVPVHPGYGQTGNNGGNSDDSDGDDGNNDNEGNNSGNEDDNNGNTDGQMSRNIHVSVAGQTFAATLEDNETARAFIALLPMTVNMTEMNGNEKYCNLSRNLPTETFRPGTIRAGDLLLWGSNTVVLFYETFSSGYSYTRLGRIDNPDGLASAVGRGNVSVTFSTAR